MENGEEEESDVDSMMNDKWHRIANTNINEVTVSVATRHLPPSRNELLPPTSLTL